MAVKNRIDKDGYVRVWTENGWRHEHQIVAEQKLGRKLGKKEVVHHKDEIKTNNEPVNLLVLRSQSDHVRIHADIPHEVIETSDGSCVVLAKQRDCPHCKKPFVPEHNRDVYCGNTCFRAATAPCVMPGKETLQTLVNSMPTTKVAAQFGVSDVAVSKWCKKLGVSKPTRGHWWKVETGTL